MTAKKTTPWWENPMAQKVLTVCAAVAVLSLIVWWFFLHPYVRTDDARVAMTLVRVAPSGVSARIEKVNVTEGSKVKAGDIVVELDHRVTQANVDKAKAKVNLTQRERNRLERLYADSSATQQSLEIARANADEAEAELKLAEVALENTYLKSPFDGVVIQKLAEVGNLLESGQTAVVVADVAHAWIAANIEETSAADLKIGQPVSISIDEGGDMEGEVSEIRQSVAAQFALIPSDNGAGNFTKVVQRIPIKVALKNISERPLRAGQSVEIKIKVR